MDNLLLEKLAIRDVVDNWAMWRDAGEWDKLGTTFHPDAVFKATWFHGPFSKFVELSSERFRQGGKSMHFLGGTTVEVAGTRAVAQTKMAILSRAMLEANEVDTTAYGRFYDRFEKRDGVWRIALRDCIYEKTKIEAVDPAVTLHLEPALLNSFPEGYRHLTYVQTKAGRSITSGLATARGAELEALYAVGRVWLAGAKA
jgi:SnoaL-like domain